MSSSERPADFIEMFGPEWPDRSELAEATGWDCSASRDGSIPRAGSIWQRAEAGSQWHPDADRQRLGFNFAGSGTSDPSRGDGQPLLLLH